MVAFPKKKFFQKKEDHHAKRSPRQNLKDVRGKAQESGKDLLERLMLKGAERSISKTIPSGLMATVNRNLLTPVDPLEDQRQFPSPEPPLQEVGLARTFQGHPRSLRGRCKHPEDLRFFWRGISGAFSLLRSLTPLRSPQSK